MYNDCNHIFALAELQLLLQFSVLITPIMAKMKCLKVETSYPHSSLISPLNICFSL